MKKPTQKMKATARRIPRRVAEDIEEEPNMKLSSAFVVVLLLHVVAVGGIYAFNSIKARRADAMPEESPAAAVAPASPAREPLMPVSSRAIEESPVHGPRVYQVQPGDTLAKIASEYGVTVSAIEEANNLKNVAMLRIGQELRIPAQTPKKADPAPAKKTAPPPQQATKPDGKSGAIAWSGESYTVVKGDNPVAIARKFHVNYSDLLELNAIEDPRRLQIDQVLKIPVKRD